jgi:hypothetical protein
MYGGTAILSWLERAGELIFESLEFGVFQLRAHARWGYSNPEFTLIAVFLPFMVLGERLKAAEARAYARRFADARMNARLLRLNL